MDNQKQKYSKKTYIFIYLWKKKLKIVGIDVEQDKVHRTCDLCIFEIQWIKNFRKTVYFYN